MISLTAARRNGRFDQAYELSAQMVATSWPWFDGELLLPQKLSHPCAPMLGEAALAYFLTLQPAEGVPIVSGGGLTPLVWFALCVYFGVFLFSLRIAFRAWRSVRRGAPQTNRSTPSVPSLSRS